MVPSTRFFNGKKFFIATCLCMLVAPSILLASRLTHGGMLMQTATGISSQHIPNAFAYRNHYRPLTEWIFDKTVDNVDCYHRITECNGKNVVFLKFNNKNSYKVTITWKEVFVTKQAPGKQGGKFGQKQLVLASGETSPSDCTDIKLKACIIGPDGVSPTYQADILEFYYNDISVAIAQ